MLINVDELELKTKYKIGSIIYFGGTAKAIPQRYFFHA